MSIPFIVICSIGRLTDLYVKITKQNQIRLINIGHMFGRNNNNVTKTGTNQKNSIFPIVKENKNVHLVIIFLSIIKIGTFFSVCIDAKNVYRKNARVKFRKKEGITSFMVVDKRIKSAYSHQWCYQHFVGSDVYIRFRLIHITELCATSWLLLLLWRLYDVVVVFLCVLRMVVCLYVSVGWCCWWW